MSDIRETSLTYLESAFSDFEKTIDLTVGNNAREMAIDILTNVIKRSPIDSGRLRAAWNLSVDKPDYSVPRFKKAKKGQVVHTPKPIPNLNAPPFSKIYITNAVHYVLAIEDGTSKQTPKHMLALSVDDTIERFKSGL